MSRRPLPAPPDRFSRSLSALIRNALREDIGTGDVSAAIFPDKEIGRARIVAKQPGIMSGSETVDEVFRQLSSTSSITWLIKNGERFSNGAVIAEITAPLPTLLSGERTALNFLQRLCAIATLSGRFVAALRREAPGAHGPRIYDTRKTTPSLRLLEKRAVLDGGARNHRIGLYDMAMLKNNHVDAAGGIEAAVHGLSEIGFFRRKPRLPLCIEARSSDEAIAAMDNRADIVMLDNMSPREVRRTVAIMTSRAMSEAKELPEIEISGGITLANLRTYAKLPIDRISIGALTHSAGALDIAMRYSSKAKKATRRLRLSTRVAK